MNRVRTALKITGTFALGVLTGMHLNFSLQTLRTLLALNSAGGLRSRSLLLREPLTDPPAPAQARRAFALSVGLLRSTARPAELVAAASLVAAWLLSPRGGRHPYLLLATLPLAAAVGVERLELAGVEYGVRAQAEGEGEAEVNGEAIEVGMEAWRRWGAVRGGLLGVGFAVSLVGIYGDFM